MRSIHKRIFAVILLTGFTGCAVRPPRVPVRESPEIRVGLLEGLRRVEFTARDRFRIENEAGIPFGGGQPGSRWYAEVIQSVPGRVTYHLTAGSMHDRGEARRRAAELETKGIATEIRVSGRPLVLGGRVVTTNRQYRIFISGVFDTHEEAAAAGDSLGGLVRTSVTREVSRRPEGLLRVVNPATGQEYKSTGPILIRGASVTLHDFPVGSGFHWERTEDQTYPEIIQFDLDATGLLAVINRVPLEVYVEGVIPSEMPPGFPLEALKAQAVAARGKVLGAWGVVHQADPYDVCARVHCQVYSGLSKRDPRTDQAARETAGIVLFSGDRLVDAIFGGVCGGHTEDVDLAWGGQPYAYLKGTLDGPHALRRYGPLHIEENARRWIDAHPPSHCNTNRNPVPASLNYTKKYFRWEVRLTRDEIRQALAKRHIDIGDPVALIPLERGVSGRIVRLRIAGTRGETIIRGELNIRQALSPTTLWSSCFYVREAEDGFAFKGAGWGHGVGMCQTGAAMMAEGGKKFDAILRHYYRDVQFRRLY